MQRVGETMQSNGQSHHLFSSDFQSDISHTFFSCFFTPIHECSLSIHTDLFWRAWIKLRTNEKKWTAEPLLREEKNQPTPCTSWNARWMNKLSSHLRGISLKHAHSQDMAIESDSKFLQASLPIFDANRCDKRSVEEIEIFKARHQFQWLWRGSAIIVPLIFFFVFVDRTMTVIVSWNSALSSVGSSRWH